MRFGGTRDTGPRTVVLARFGSPVAADAARDALESILESVAAEIEELFERRGGEADAAEVAAIGERHGLGAAIGWDAESPIAVNGPDLAWTLPPDADPEEAEQLIRQLGAVDAVVQETEGGEEEWRATPHPMILPLPGEEIDPFDADDEDASSEKRPVRTIH